MDGQNHRVLVNRGSQGRKTPDRKREIRYTGIAPSFSIVR